MSKLVAVFAAGGNRGATIAAAVLQRGYRVRAITRTGANARRLLGDRVESVTATLEQPASIAAALAGVDSVILILPIGSRTLPRQDATRWVINAARQAGVTELISVLGGYAGLRYLPVMSTATMTALGDLTLESGIPSLVLSPTLFVENLRAPAYQPGLHDEGLLVFPPVTGGRRFSLTTYRDQAVLTAAALDRPDLQGELHQIASPPALTGPELAALISPWFERDIVHQELTPAEYGARLVAASNQPAAGDAIEQMWTAMNQLRDDALVVDTDALAARFQVRLMPIPDQITTWRPKAESVPVPPPAPAPAATAAGAEDEDADSEFAPLASDRR